MADERDRCEVCFGSFQTGDLFVTFLPVGDGPRGDAMLCGNCAIVAISDGLLLPSGAGVFVEARHRTLTMSQLSPELREALAEGHQKVTRLGKVLQPS